MSGRALWVGERAKKFAKLWGEGASYQLIAWRFGLTLGQVQKVRVRLGLPTRGKGHVPKRVLQRQKRVLETLKKRGPCSVQRLTSILMMRYVEELCPALVCLHRKGKITITGPHRHKLYAAIEGASL